MELTAATCYQIVLRKDFMLTSKTFCRAIDDEDLKALQHFILLNG